MKKSKKVLKWDWRKYRYETGKTYVDVAKEIGVTRGFIYNLLNGRDGANARFLMWLVKQGYLKSPYIKIEEKK